MRAIGTRGSMGSRPQHLTRAAQEERQPVAQLPAKVGLALCALGHWGRHEARSMFWCRSALLSCVIADKAFYQQPDADIIGYVASEEAFVKESKEETPGTEWEKVAQLCDFNPKSSKQCKDVSRLRSVLMSLKQTPLSR
ncbi:clathrin light chain B [Carlito syrichta]|uniref:Clathrin light chain n=1 Tax=Carlito syrichta TaxID=1868482 RepID=A0A3Q0DDM1_CARSF|nr:clathrin light chain B [Carlito syrichta]